MSSPRNGGWVSLKRVVRYLLGKPRLVWRFVWQDAPKCVSALSDSNWAGCHDTRKSTSGACIMHGSHLIKAYSRTQSNIALSSGEAEYYALVSTASEALGIVAMTEDFGDRTEAYLYADASAAIGVANREGLGRIRHLDTQSLWLQQVLRKKRLGLGKVLGIENPSDLMTKHVDSKLLGEHTQSMGCEFVGGRAELALQVVQGVGDDTGAEDVVECIDDELSGLMTTSTMERSATSENHCAIETEMCLSERLLVHRSVDEDCEGGSDAREGVTNCRLGSNQIDRDYEKRMSRDEHLRGHPNFLLLRLLRSFVCRLGSLVRGEVLVSVPFVPID
jgi:hypothetical protein